LPGDDGSRQPGGVRAAILSSASAFLGTASPRDDVALVVARFA